MTTTRDEAEQLARELAGADVEVTVQALLDARHLGAAGALDQLATELTTKGQDAAPVHLLRALAAGYRSHLTANRP